MQAVYQEMSSTLGHRSALVLTNVSDSWTLQRDGGGWDVREFVPSKGLILSVSFSVYIDVCICELWVTMLKEDGPMLSLCVTQARAHTHTGDLVSAAPWWQWTAHGWLEVQWGGPEIKPSLLFCRIWKGWGSETVSKKPRNVFVPYFYSVCSPCWSLPCCLVLSVCLWRSSSPCVLKCTDGVWKRLS